MKESWTTSRASSPLPTIPTATPNALTLYLSMSSANAPSSPARVVRISASSGTPPFSLSFIGRRRPAEYSPCPTGKSVDFPPVLTPAYRNGQGNRQLRHPLHRRLQDPLGSGRLPLGRLDDQFVVDLEDQPRFHPGLAELPVDPDHRHLDQVGGASLDRRVDRHPLRRLPQHLVPGFDVLQEPAASHDRQYISVFSGTCLQYINVFLDARIPIEIVIDIRLRLLSADPQFARQPERAHAVEDAEVDHLRPAPQLRGNGGRVHAEDGGRRRGVDVVPLTETADQLRVPGQVGKQPQLHLGVVGPDEEIPLLRDEPRPDPSAELGTDRDVLQVRIGGGEPAGGL